MMVKKTAYLLLIKMVLQISIDLWKLIEKDKKQIWTHCSVLDLIEGENVLKVRIKTRSKMNSKTGKLRLMRHLRLTKKLQKIRLSKK